GGVWSVCGEKTGVQCLGGVGGAVASVVVQVPRWALRSLSLCHVVWGLLQDSPQTSPRLPSLSLSLSHTHTHTLTHTHTHTLTHTHTCTHTQTQTQTHTLT